MSDLPDGNRLISKAEAAKLRIQAGELLQRLIDGREMSERRAAETGKRDPMKFITGHTALENAIASTRQMIDELDALLLSADSMSPELVGANGCNGSNGSNGSHRPSLRPSARSTVRPSVRAAALTAAP